MRVAGYALGCKVNQYETEALNEAFAARGHEIVEIDQAADLYVINTCSVTNLGDKKSRQLIRRVKRQNPQAMVAVIGCYAQVAPEELAKLPEINLLLGTGNRREIVELAEHYRPEMGLVNRVSSVAQTREFEPLSIDRLSGRTRGYLKIQDGCDRYCSYCIIPYARGPVRSRTPEDVLAEVKRLAQNGFAEVVLTGIHVASYGKDLKNIDLAGLLAQVHQVPGIERIRLSSVEPRIVTADFVEQLQGLPKVCPHFHLSLQSGCDKTLKEMNRRYTAEEYAQAAALLRAGLPGTELTTDVIVGFPGETEEDFLESLAFVEKMDFLKVHVFPYSPKRGTPAAARKDQLSGTVKAERVERMLCASHQSAQRRLSSYLGQVLPVLAEEEVAPGIREGFSPQYVRVRFAAPDSGQVYPVLAQAVDGETVLGKIALHPEPV